MDNLVVVDRDVAHVFTIEGTGIMLPDQIAGLAIKGLNNIAGINQINDAVINQR